jgi:hypothetical protein
MRSDTGIGPRLHSFVAARKSDRSHRDPGLTAVRREHADYRQLARLLRPRRERPRRRAAEQRDETSPIHSITSSARASSIGGTSIMAA